MLTISICDGEYEGDLGVLTHLCDIEGSVVPDGWPPFSLLEEALRVLEMCEERYSTPPLSGTAFTVFIGRKDGLKVTPLVRLDGYAHNGEATATVMSETPSWNTERVKYAPGDDAVAIVRKLLEPSRWRNAKGAAVRYEDLIRDACNEELMESTRVHAAFDAIYCCCQPGRTLDEALESLNLSAEDAALVSKLAAWVVNVAPLGPLPMSPSDAVALAERIHKNMGAR